MSMSESGQYDLLDQLAEEFADRFRRGERPSLKEYTDRYPELAEEIRELFPAMVRVEQVEAARQEENVEEVTEDSRAGSPSLTQIGDYQILREIGRGGMGVVYEAEQISLGRRVALKILPKRVGSDRMTAERFRREARRRTTAPHQHRACLRRGPGRRCPLLRHAVYPGSGPGHDHYRTASASLWGRIRARGQGGHRGPVAQAFRRTPRPRRREPNTR
jgi:hypothetical protein